MSRIFKFRVWDGKKFTLEPRLDVVLLNLPNKIGQIISFGKIIQLSINRLDRNGKEIYEGDIVEYIEKMFEHGDAQKLTGLVKYDDYFSAYGISKTEDGDCMNYFTDMTIDHFKVIGNIFENPELLTKNDNK